MKRLLFRLLVVEDGFPSADGGGIEEELGEQTVGMALQMLRFKIVVML